MDRTGWLASLSALMLMIAAVFFNADRAQDAAYLALLLLFAASLSAFSAPGGGKRQRVLITKRKESH